MKSNILETIRIRMEKCVQEKQCDITFNNVSVGESWHCKINAEAALS